MKEGHPYDTVVIGAGQAGLASADYLQRAGSRFLVLDGASQTWRVVAAALGLARFYALCRTDALVTKAFAMTGRCA